MSARTPWIGGNWKCNGNADANRTLVDGLNTADLPANVDILVFPTALHLREVQSVLRREVTVGAQNCYHTDGAFTGEISVRMLVDAGISTTLLGHSERRHVFGESNSLLTTKTKAVQEARVGLVACVGELLEDRDANRTMDVVTEQLQAFADGISDWTSVVLAYEPVWAIGTGRVATPEQAEEVHVAIRNWLKDNVSTEVSEATRIVYGGSVKPDNCQDLAKQPNVDGFLVGGASLKASDFVAICSAFSS